MNVRVIIARMVQHVWTTLLVTDTFVSLGSKASIVMRVSGNSFVFLHCSYCLAVELVEQSCFVLQETGNSKMVLL